MNEMIITNACEAAEVLEGIEQVLMQGDFANVAKMWPIIISVRALAAWVDMTFND